MFAVLLQRYDIVNGVVEVEGVAKETLSDEGADKVAAGM